MCVVCIKFLVNILLVKEPPATPALFRTGQRDDLITYKKNQPEGNTRKLESKRSRFSFSHAAQITVVFGPERCKHHQIYAEARCHKTNHFPSWTDLAYTGDLHWDKCLTRALFKAGSEPNGSIYDIQVFRCLRIFHGIMRSGKRRVLIRLRQYQCYHGNIF